MAARAVVCYESKYGNTERLAQAIGEAMRRLGGMDVTVTPLRRIDAAELGRYDLILVGGPTHFGGPTRRVTRFIEAMARGNLAGKGVAVFDTYLGEDFEKSVNRMEEQIRATLPGMHIVAPGLSIRVADMKGPIVDGELLKCEDFAKRLVAQPVMS